MTVPKRRARRCRCETVEPTFREVSEVPAPVEKVWQRVTSPEGINHELGPFLKMTMPR